MSFMPDAGSPAYTPPAPKKREEDVADWEVRMNDGEIIKVSSAVPCYGSDRVSLLKANTRGLDGLLYGARWDEIKRIIRIGDNVEITRPAQPKAA